MKFSYYQQNFFNEVQNGNSSILLEAVAGSGKTTTVIEAAKLIPADKRVLLIAFNKSIADELKRRAPQHVMVSTFHALGFGVWRRYAGGSTKVHDGKTWDILDELIPPQWKGKKKILSPMRQAIGPFIKRLVALAKDEGIGLLMEDKPESYEALIEHHDLYIDVPLARVGAESYDELQRAAIGYVQQVIQRSRQMGEDVVDFADMLWLPLVEELQTFFKNDFVFIDEAQDVSATQREILKRTLKPTGRLIAVGDRSQAIYAWRGAAVNSMDLIRDEFSCIEMPLSITYRCPKAVVAEAQRYVPQITAPDWAPNGIVETLTSYTPDDFSPHDAILSRTTAPLIDMAYWLIQHGKGAKVLGREIGQNLSKLIERMKANSIEELEENLTFWAKREIEKAQQKSDDAKVMRIEDQVACVTTMIGGLNEDNRTIEGLLDNIDGLFSDQNGVTICSTVHKAKGLEWDRVFYLDPDKATPWARKEWQQLEERNIKYVATTRAKQHLVYLTRDGRKDK